MRIETLKPRIYKQNGYWYVKHPVILTAARSSRLTFLHYAAGRTVENAFSYLSNWYGRKTAFRLQRKGHECKS